MTAPHPSLDHTETETKECHNINLTEKKHSAEPSVKTEVTGDLSTRQLRSFETRSHLHWIGTTAWTEVARAGTFHIAIVNCIGSFGKLAQASLRGTAPTSARKALNPSSAEQTSR